MIRRIHRRKVRADDEYAAHGIKSRLVGENQLLELGEGIERVATNSNRKLCADCATAFSSDTPSLRSASRRQPLAAISLANRSGRAWARRAVIKCKAGLVVSNEIVLEACQLGNDDGAATTHCLECGDTEGLATFVDARIGKYPRLKKMPAEFAWVRDKAGPVNAIAFAATPSDTRAQPSS